MSAAPQRSLRREYLDWVEEQIEEFKDRIPRRELLAIADTVVHDLRVTGEGQYQLTELLLCNAMDRRIFKMLKLPGYRAWRTRRLEGEAAARVIPLPPLDRLVASSAPVHAPRDTEDAVEEAEAAEPLACVV